MRNIDGRLNDLIAESEIFRNMNDGRTHNHPDFVTWRKRAEMAVDQKLGESSRSARQIHQLRFYRFSGIPSYHPTTQEHALNFEKDLNTAVGILKAAYEADPATKSDSRSPLVSINQVGPSASASASSTAEVTIQMSADELRQLIATAPELSSVEKGEGVASVPDDEVELTLDKVDKLLGIATKSKDLAKGILGWILINADRIPWS